MLQPGYPLFDFLAVLDDVRLKEAELVYDHGWQIDPAGLRAGITAQTRAIMLVHPNNPTGHFTKRWEAEELGNRLPRAQPGADRRRSLSGLPRDGQPGSETNGHVCRGPRGRRRLRRQRPQQDRRPAPDEGRLDRGHRAQHSPRSRAPRSHCRYLPFDECPGSTGASGMAERTRGHPKADPRDGSRTNLTELDRLLAQAPGVSRLEVEGGWYATLRIPALQPDHDTVLLSSTRESGSIPATFSACLAPAGWCSACSRLLPNSQRVQPVWLTIYERTKVVIVPGNSLK